MTSKSNKKMEPLMEFPAMVYKVQTLIDGGLRVTLDLPETAIAEAAWLMECKRSETPLKINAKKEVREIRESIH